MAKLAKTIADARLADVPLDKVFWSSDGRVLKNLPELETALREMSDETYLYHANESKNDFAEWVNNVIGDDKLARDLRRNATRYQASRSVAERVAWLRSRAE